MAIERVVRCDSCGEYVKLEDRRRIGVRRDEDRPESADWVDLCPQCRDKHNVTWLVFYAETHRPEDGNGDPA